MTDIYFTDCISLRSEGIFILYLRVSTKCCAYTYIHVHFSAKSKQQHLITHTIQFHACAHSNLPAQPSAFVPFIIKIQFFCLVNVPTIKSYSFPCFWFYYILFHYVFFTSYLWYFPIFLVGSGCIHVRICICIYVCMYVLMQANLCENFSPQRNNRSVIHIVSAVECKVPIERSLFDCAIYILLYICMYVCM